MSKNILAIIDLDHYPEIVTQRAAKLAEHCGAELTLLLCETRTRFLTDSLILTADALAVADEIKAMELKSLEELKDSVANQNIRVHITYSYDYPVIDAILKKAEELSPEYVVKGTHYHDPVERAGMTDVDWQLIRKLNYPLWFARPKTYEADATIVAAVDPTHGKDKPASLDTEIIRQAKKIAGYFGGRLELLHSYQRLQEINKMATWAIKPEKLPIDELDEKIRDEHAGKLAELAKANDIEDDAVHQLPGKPSEILPIFARTHGAGIVVMGAVSRSALKSRFLGSTAQRTLDHLNCDVLIVHPAAEADSGQAAA